MMPLTSPTDEELTRRAQAGETGALGLLLARHQAPMRAVAMSLLGYGPDAEDVVQDAALTALRRIGDVRDPAAVGAWLRAIVRNAARMRLRVTRETPGLDGLDQLHPCDHEPSHPERVVEQHAMRDWIWDAVEELPEQLRLVLMLRHFSGITSYQEIAAACEIPVGTVRSRLNQARAKLAQVLLSTATQAHDDASALTEDSRQEALVTLQGAARGDLPREIAELWRPRPNWSVRSAGRENAPTPSRPCGRTGNPGCANTCAMWWPAGTSPSGRWTSSAPGCRPSLPADPRLAHVPPGQKSSTTTGGLPRTSAVSVVPAGAAVTIKVLAAWAASRSGRRAGVRAGARSGRRAPGSRSGR